MNTHDTKSAENKSQTAASHDAQKQSSRESTFQFVDNRPETVMQRKLQQMANNSPVVAQRMISENSHPNNAKHLQVVIQKKGGNKSADYKYGKLNSNTHVHAFNKEGGHVKLLGSVFKYGTKGNEMGEAETFFRANQEALQKKCDPSDYNGLWKWIQKWKQK